MYSFSWRGFEFLAVVDGVEASVAVLCLDDVRDKPVDHETDQGGSDGCIWQRKHLDETFPEPPFSAVVLCVQQRRRRRYFGHDRLRNSAHREWAFSRVYRENVATLCLQHDTVCPTSASAKKDSNNNRGSGQVGWGTGFWTKYGVQHIYIRKQR